MTPLIAAVACTLTFGTWNYGIPTGAPQPSISIAQDMGGIHVREALGDRAFTVVDATYDDHLKLVTAQQHGACCGGEWDAAVSRNPDGTYDISGRSVGPSGTYTEHLAGFNDHESDVPVFVGSTALVPWIVNRTHAQQIMRISFTPIKTEFVPVTSAKVDTPEGVPKTDVALALRTLDGSVLEYLWYDPCTFTVDAYGRNRETAVLRVVK